MAKAIGIASAAAIAAWIAHPVQPDLLDKRVLGSNELAPRRRRMLDKLQVAAGPGANIGMETPGVVEPHESEQHGATIATSLGSRAI